MNSPEAMQAAINEWIEADAEWRLAIDRIDISPDRHEKRGLTTRRLFKAEASLRALADK